MSESICECCGASLKRHKHSLSALLIKALYALYEKGEPCQVKALGFSHSMINNFQKLQYWQFIERASTESADSKWVVTERGVNFLWRELDVPRFVWTFRNAIDELSDEMVTRAEVVADADSWKWKTREEYQADVTNVPIEDAKQPELFERPRL